MFLLMVTLLESMELRLMKEDREREVISIHAHIRS